MGLEDIEIPPELVSDGFKRMQPPTNEDMVIFVEGGLEFVKMELTVKGGSDAVDWGVDWGSDFRDVDMGVEVRMKCVVVMPTAAMHNTYHCAILLLRHRWGLRRRACGHLRAREPGFSSLHARGGAGFPEVFGGSQMHAAGLRRRTLFFASANAESVRVPTLR